MFYIMTIYVLIWQGLLKKRSYDLKTISIIEIIYEYMCHLNILLSYPKTFRTH